MKLTEIFRKSISHLLHDLIVYRKMFKIKSSLKKLKIKLSILDIGAAGKSQTQYQFIKKYIHEVRVDPAFTNPTKNEYSVALAEKPGDYFLNITKHPGCSSVLEPDAEGLKDLPLWSDMFSVVGSKKITATTFKKLSSENSLPQFDFIKLDVQGFELQVLRGFESTLDEALGIQLETHLRQVYKNQALFYDLTLFMKEKGFKLRDLNAVGPSSGRELIELDAFFYREPKNLEEELKLTAWEQLNQLRRFNTEWKLGPSWKQS